MVQRPRPDLRGGCAAMRIPTVTVPPSRLGGRDRLTRSGVRGRPETPTGGMTDAEHEPRDPAGPCRARP